MSHRFIAVEGPIGVGKTTLARRIAESTGATMLYDPEAQNPFLEDFYNKSGNWALQTQLDFLIRRTELLEEMAESGSDQAVVCDFLIEKDRLFAELTLNEDELWLYDKVSERLPEDLPKPDLLIYLQASPDVLMDRIEMRGFAFEQRMASGYLQRLSDMYASFVLDYTDSPLLIINASEIDFANNSKDYTYLLEQVREISAGRHYLNPLPT